MFSVEMKQGHSEKVFFPEVWNCSLYGKSSSFFWKFTQNIDQLINSYYYLGKLCVYANELMFLNILVDICGVETYCCRCQVIKSSHLSEQILFVENNEENVSTRHLITPTKVHVNFPK